MPTITIHLDADPRFYTENLRKLERIQQIFGTLQEYVVKPELEKAARNIALLAQSLAPKRTGYMASQIKDETNPPRIVGYAYYTPYVEKGHWTVNRRRFIQGQHFLRIATEEELPQAGRRIELRIMSLVRESE